MIIITDKPYTKQELLKVREQFDTYIKTVIDIEKKLCSAGCDRHFDSEQLLLSQGSKQLNLWGGGIDVVSCEIDCKSFINIRPSDGNQSNDILTPSIRKKFELYMKYFFKNL